MLQQADNARPKGPFLRALEWACALLMAAMVVLLFTQVFARYVLASSPPWTEELARGAFIHLTFLGSAVAVVRRAHLKIDAVTGILPPRVQAALGAISHVLIIAFLVVLAVQGFVLLEQLSSQSLVSVPISKGAFFVAVPIGAVLMLFYELHRLRDEIRRLRSRRPPPEPPRPIVEAEA